MARGEELLRISPTPNHTEEMIDDLAESLMNAFEEVGVDVVTGDDIFMNRGEDYKIFMENITPFDSRTRQAFFSNRGQKQEEEEELEQCCDECTCC